MIAHGNITQLEDCNHSETDTHLILEAYKVDAPVIVQATDTDVLILMVHTFPNHVLNQK